MSVGVVYAIMRSPGGRYLNEVASSVDSLRRHNPRISIQLVTDKDSDITENPLFDTITIVDNGPSRELVLRAKIDALSLAKYDANLFLDSDTYICGDIRPLFSLAKHYDLAMAYAPRRRDPEWSPPDMDIPPWLPEFNSGVILMRKSNRTARFLTEWRQLYMEYAKWNDQMALRVALFRSLDYGLKVYPLPPEYNCRTLCMAQLGDKAYILHGRGDMHKIASQINAGNGIRMYIPAIGLFRRKDWKHVKSR